MKVRFDRIANVQFWGFKNIYYIFDNKMHIADKSNVHFMFTINLERIFVKGGLMLKEKIHDAGFIKFKNTVVVTDPCYATGIWCSKLLGNVKEGKFKCLFRILYDEESGRRVSSLIAIHEGFLKCIDFKDKFQFDSKKICKIPYYNVIGVDSGQAGIFNYDYYVAHQPDDNWEPDIKGNKSWYRKVCDITGSEQLGGVIDNNGVVSQSGDGDGPYNCFTFYDIKTEEIIGIVIDYQVK